MSEAASGAVPATGTNVAGLSHAKRALLEQRRKELLRRRGGTPTASEPSQPTLSFAQERLWLLAQVTPGLIAYNTTRVVRLDGRADPQRLRSGLSWVIERHEVLRTRIVRRPDGQPGATVSADTSCEVDLVSAATEADAQTHVRQFALRPFDLERDTLIRALVVSLADGFDLLVLSLHHIASDEASRDVLWRDLAVGYTLAGADDDAPPPLPMQYSDFASRQREQLSGARLATELAWWRAQLAGAPEHNGLPTDFLRPGEQSYRGNRHSITIEVELANRLRSLANASAATMFVTVLAGYAFLLARWSGNTDVVVGMPVSGRGEAETQNMIGLFVNTVVLRIDCSGEPTFTEMIERTRRCMAEALVHQELPFDRLVQELAPRRDLGRTPLFQVLVNGITRTQSGTYALGELTARALSFDPGTTKFDTGILFADEADGSAELVVEYTTDLYTPATAANQAAQVVSLLEQGSANPQEPLASLDITPLDQRNRFVAELNATESPIPDGCLHELFIEQAARTPDLRAVGDDRGWLTYRELDERSNQLAHRLSALGVGPDVPVGIAVERSTAMHIAVLATLKAGGAYVPLDTSYPTERLAYMLSDSQAAVLVTDSSLREQLPAHPATILMDTVWSEIEALPLTPPATAVRSTNLAYIIYTSGTTGRPKGVLLEHRGVVNRLDWMQREFGLSSHDVVLQKTPLSFDVSVWEVLWPVLYGASLFMARPDGHKDARYLQEVIRDRAISVMHFVPSMLALFLQTAGPIEDGSSLRLVVCSGEALPEDLREQFFRSLPGTELYNLYGPTEASIDVTSARLRPGRESPVMIGAPIANTQVYVVDETGRPVGSDVPGELWLAGVGLARGYHGLPELTAEKFIRTELAPLGRGYRTGDLVRWRSDGQLDYLGRIDNQIKLRGFRIELSEIEAVIAAHREVLQVVADLAPGPSGEPMVAAYLVLRAETADSDSALAPSGTGSDPDDEHAHQNSQQVVWQQTYSDAVYGEAKFDTSGWVSSFTGEPIGRPEMQEWLEATVEAVKAQSPRAVLEVGSGSGLVLWRLAGDCTRYVATDFSAAVVDRLTELAGGQQNIEPRHLAADEISALNGELFDTVIVNSVAQYFPSADYLIGVLEDASALLQGEGRIFLGDVRDLTLLDAFLLAVELRRAPSPVSVGQLRLRLSDRRALESELVLHPEFFRSLTGFRDLRHVQIMPKRGTYRTEMNGFRFDVVLHFGGDEPRSLAAEVWRPWSDYATDLARLEAELQDPATETVGVIGVPDARVAAELAAVDDLADSRLPTSGPAPVGVEVDDLAALARSTGRYVLFEVGQRPGTFDVLFSQDPIGRVRFPRADSTGVSVCATDPVSAMRLRSRRAIVIADVDRALRTKLPEYMVPSILRVIESMPLGLSGKLDRKALVLPEGVRGAAEVVEPSTATEHAIVGVWRDLLGIRQISVTDDFFSLGGHSLLAVRMLAGIFNALGCELPLRCVFDRPTVRDLAIAVDDRLESAPGGSNDVSEPSGDRIPAAEGERLESGGLRYPLSAAQERMWFLDQLDVDQPRYVVRRAYRVSGGLDAQRLQDCFTVLARRHASLRTTVLAEGDALYQAVSETGRWPVTVTDLQAESDPLAMALEIAAAEAEVRFDLSEGPLATASLIRLGADDDLLVLRLHHIVVDGWSMDVLMQELSTLYGDPRELGTTIDQALPAVGVQYPDFSCWQNTAITAAELDKQLDYWRQALAGAPSTIDLPIDQPNANPLSYKGSRVSKTLPAPLARAVAELASSHATTPFVVLVAASVALLHSVSGQDDIVVGTPVAGRLHPDLAPVIGLFTNTLVLRTEVSPGLDFTALVARVHRTVTEAQAHQDLPFERLVSELAPRRDLSQNPLFQVMINLQPPSDGIVRLGPSGAGQLSLVPFELDTAVARFDLSFAFIHNENQLSMSIDFRTDIFRSATVEAIAARLEAVLLSATAGPGIRLSDLPTLLPGERHELLQLGAGPALSLPTTNVIGLIAAVVDKRAACTAVADASEELTYAELWRRSESLAAGISAVAPKGSIIAIMTGRTVDLVVAALAVWRAGCAYLPLDSTYPADRLSFMLSDSRAAVVLVDDATRNLVPGDLDSDGVCILDVAVAQGRRDFEPVTPTGNDPAYVIYTSGSTGVPKGVLVEHSALANLLVSMAFEPGFDETDVLLAVTTFSFDIAALELFLPLIAGGSVVLVEREISTDPQTLAHALRQHHASVMQATPATWRMLLDDEWRPERNLRALCGGEPLPIDLARALLSQSVELWNCYGPTETTIWSTVARVRDPEAITVGRPIANTLVYVLDAHGHLVPPGSVGELFIAGAGVAQGYWDRPELTGARFVADPWRPGEVMYRTGDLVRWNADGALVCLGRADSQIKLRGHRIELGEIEAVLAADDRVAQAVATVWEEGPGDQRLVAYVVLTGETDVDKPLLPTGSEDALRQELRDLLAGLRSVLPAPFVPAVIASIAAVPQTLNGKIDRRALPHPRELVSSADSADTPAAPLTDAESALAQLWSELLQTAVTRSDDDFFALGGHSLMATRLLARVATRLGTRLALRAVFENSTLGAMADLIQIAEVSNERGPTIRARDRRQLELDDLAKPELLSRALAGQIDPVATGTGGTVVTIFPMSSAQRRMWILQHMYHASHEYNVPLLRKVAGELDAATLQLAVDAVVTRHEILRTTYRQDGDLLTQVVHPSMLVTVGEVSVASQAELLRSARDEALRPFDLERGPIIRVLVIHQRGDDGPGPDGQTVLVITAHHIALDGWSIDVLLQQVLDAYRDGGCAEPSTQTQFGDFAVWEAERFSSGELDTDLEFWLKELELAPTETVLPLTWPRPDIASQLGGRVRRSLEPGLARELTDLAQTVRATPFMAVTAAVAVLLNRHGAGEDIVLGTPVAMRNFAGGEDLIGALINTLPLRIRLDQQHSFVDLLASVTTTANAAYAHASYPFDRLVSQLGLSRQANRHPVFQVMVSMQQERTASIEGRKDLRLDPMQIDWDVARYELAFLFAPSGDGIDIALEYRQDLFDRATVEWLLDRLVQLITAAVEASSAALAELAVLNVSELARVHEWAGNIPSGTEPSVPELIDGWVRRTPDANAVEVRGRTMTFAQLDAAAEGLARRLRLLLPDQSGPGVRVIGIAIGHSLSWPVAVMAVWKAGLAYVPLDPAYPAARLEFMLADSHCAIVIADAATEGVFAQFPGLDVLTADDPAADEQLARARPIQDGSTVMTGVALDAAAYIIYTSGSTGQPKGTVVSHRSLAALAASHAVAFGSSDTPKLRAALNSPVGFDVSVGQLVWMAYGHSLLPIPEEIRLDPPKYFEYLDRWQIDVLDITPSHLRVLIESGLLQATPFPSTILVAGEAIEADLWSILANSGRKVLNVYGPTEATVYAVVCDVTTSPTPIIGHPLSNVLAYVVDAQERLVPPGVPGELWLGGDQLATAYLGQPELTSLRFPTIADGPRQDRVPAGRWYRTGDVVRHRSSGELEFVGRTDDQVKIRGHRVEPGEVAAALRAIDGVADAVVVARRQHGAVELAAYVVFTPTSELDTSSLRYGLAAALPSYLIPATLTPLDRMPLTPNGKLDLSALPEPVRSGIASIPDHSDADIAAQAPLTPAEALIADLWTDILGVDRIGRDDDFFLLGGDSLSATRFIGQLRGMDIELPLLTVFDRPTLRFLGEALTNTLLADPTFEEGSA